MFYKDLLKILFYKAVLTIKGCVLQGSVGLEKCYVSNIMDNKNATLCLKLIIQKLLCFKYILIIFVLIAYSRTNNILKF